MTPNEGMRRYYGGLHEKECLHWADRAEHSWWARFKLKVFFKIKPEKYAEIMRRYVHYYHLNSELDVKVDNLRWQEISVWERTQKLSAMKPIRKQIEELLPKRDEAYAEVKKCEAELKKYGLHTSLII